MTSLGTFYFCKHLKRQGGAMKKHTLMTLAFLMSFLVATMAMAQYGPGARDDYGWRHGPGMGWGMMGYLIAPDVPGKLPAPKSQDWIQKMRDVLDLERLSYAQYSADAEKFNAYMPYYMVIPQEEDHIQAIERLFAAYGISADGKVAAIVDTKTIIEALQLCVKMEQDLIPRYEWLVKDAGDRDSAGILNSILLQTRHHLVMFDHALRRGGGMGPGMMHGGGYGYGMGRGMMGYGPGYGMGPGMMGGRGYGMRGGMMGNHGYDRSYAEPGKPLEMKGAKAMMENYLKSTRNPNLKLGAIKDKGMAFEAEIVTKNNSLVDKVLINKQTGRMSPVY